MSKKTPDGDPKAADLLPPDGPAPVDPRTVMRSDDALEPEVETRKIGIRRAAGLDFGNWLYRRVNWRPAGNSRRFWMQIEADDPFLKAPARPTDAPLEVYAAQRIERMDGSLPKPQPDVARAYPPVRRDDTAPAVSDPPRPRKPRPTPKKAPETKHTPEPRPAPTPPPVSREPEPAPAPVQPPAPAPVEQSPLKRLPPKPSRTKTGRIRTGRQPMNKQASQPAPQRPSAAEIRAAKERAWLEAKGDLPAEVEKPRSMDDYRQYVQLAEIQQAAHEAGEEIPQAHADSADVPRKKVVIKGEAKRKKKGEDSAPAAPPPKAAPAPVPPPKAAPAPVPAPKPKEPAKKDKPIDRSPRKAGGGGLDDLFGGSQEGRVRIGRRAPQGPEITEEGDE